MHKNASISCQQQEGNNIIKTILNVQMQPVVSKRPSKTNQEHRKRRREEGVGSEPGSPSSVQSAALEAPSHEDDQAQEDFDQAPEAEAASQQFSSADQAVIEIAKELYEQRP